MSVIHSIVSKNQIPKMIPVRQNFPRPKVEDIPAAVRQALEDEGVLSRILPGARVAITGGSRGIANINVIYRELAAICKERGAKPFIFPAMGSHGGATAEGQEGVLRHLGATEEFCGCPIISSMETDHIGYTAKNNLPVYIDHEANTADAIILVNRIKLHTSFRGPVESGLAKMAVIGMGKQKGAEICHNRGWDLMLDSILDLADYILKNSPVIFGLATVENGYDETARIAAVKAEEILVKEPELLKLSRSMMPEICFHKYDILIVDKMGKEYSGGGMDTNIISRFASSAIPPDPRQYVVTVLDLSEGSLGNAIGVGMADVTTKRLFNKWDMESSYVNNLTTGTMQNYKMPMVMESDKLAVQASLQLCRLPDSSKAKIVRIASTMEVSEMLISEALVEEALTFPHVEIIGEARDMVFDEAGNLF